MAPGHARDRDGTLTLGGVAAELLARAYGTPLLVVDLDVVDDAARALLDAGSKHRVEISYAAKAFANVAFIKHLARHPIGVDVCSMGELVTAERAGIGAERLTLHGAGKTDDELRAAAEGRVGTIAIDGIDELARFAEFASEANCAAVMLRLNVGIEAHTHAFVRTGGDDTKFGILPRDEGNAVALLSANPRLTYAGLHAHVGSQIFETKPYLATAAALLGAAGRLAKHGIVTERVVIGGGFGVPTHPDSETESLDVSATVEAVTELLGREAGRTGLRVPRLGIEPGRALVALAGTTLYSVLAVKRQPHPTFVVVDGGIAENPRPALYGARHQVLPVSAADGAEDEVTLCGRSCENDELGKARLSRAIRIGDLLAMCATGAYTYSMAGNYNRFPRPAVVGVGGGSHRLLVRRESLDDVLRNDLSA